MWLLYLLRGRWHHNSRVAWGCQHVASPAVTAHNNMHNARHHTSALTATAQHHLLLSASGNLASGGASHTQTLCAITTPSHQVKVNTAAPVRWAKLQHTTEGSLQCISVQRQQASHADSAPLHPQRQLRLATSLPDRQYVSSCQSNAIPQDTHVPEVRLVPTGTCPPAAQQPHQVTSQCEVVGASAFSAILADSLHIAAGVPTPHCVLA